MSAMTTDTGGTVNTTEDQLVAWCGEAYSMGRDAGIAAASWCYDGNSDPAARARVLAMLRDGDPAAYDFLPREPNLSGEFADDPTPLSVARDVTSEDDPAPAVQDDLAEAWERGACDVFDFECERLLAEYCEGGDSDA